MVLLIYNTVIIIEKKKHGVSETNSNPPFSFPCAFAGTPPPPLYAGNNYFCESGNPLTTYEDTVNFRYTDDQLWDGKRCDSEGQCCDTATSYLVLSIDLPDETNEHIEVRICGSEDITNDDIPIGLLDIIYVQ